MEFHNACKKTIRPALLMALLVPAMRGAAARINPEPSLIYDTTGIFRFYPKISGMDVCPLPPVVTPVDIEYDCRNTTVTDYRATGSITFGTGFVSEDGASFIAEIVPAGYGVPQATNLTGTADVNMNWIQSSTFDENGVVIDDIKQFYDDLGHGIQSQSKVFYRAGATTTYTHVVATQAIKDGFGRIVGTSLPAPIDYADFSYRPNFLQRNLTGALYDYKNFDISAGGDKTLNPDPIWPDANNSPVKGTLAWYYNKANNWEPYTPVTSFPYSREVYYNDGTGNMKKSAAGGDVVRMGSGHEGAGFVSPVINELDDYIQIRNHFFAASDLGAVPAGLQNQAIMLVKRDANSQEGMLIQDKAGNILMTARPGTDLTPPVNTVVLKAQPDDGSAIGQEYYFKILADNTSVTLSGDYTLYNMETEATTALLTGNVLNRGYYKAVANTGSVTLSYRNSWTDITYNFYNQLNQLVASISPEGIKKIHSNGLSSFAATKTAMPLTTLYTYDLRGSVINTQDPDGGLNQMIYTSDGKIRFSQNPVQALAGSFSYTNYDIYGRPTESGQYLGSIAFNSAAMTGIIDNTSPGGGLTAGTKTDVSAVQYDLADNSHGLSGYVQDPVYLGVRVSVTRKYSTIVNNTPDNANLMSASWYNYDPEGRMVWKVEYINGLGSGVADVNSYKTTDYYYDIAGRPVKRVFQAGKADMFTHTYDYDPISKQLWHVYTSTAASPSPMLQATYLYYLHGGIKRVELATNLQGIDYTYTLQGDLKAINNNNASQDPGNDGSGNGFSTDAFGEVLDYYTGDYVNDRSQLPVVKGVDGSSIPESYVGNIKAMSWFSKKPASVLSVDPNAEAPTVTLYNYDPKYQFTESTWGTGLNFSNSPATFTPSGIKKEKIGDAGSNLPAYDQNGNILNLQRTDAAGATSDKFSYQYGSNSNQLMTVTNVTTSQPYATFTYDARGQIIGENTGDGNQKYMEYDVTGKVSAVYRDAGHTQPLVKFVYDENGLRIKKLDYNAGQLSQVTFYIDGNVYTQTVTGGSTFGTVTPQEYAIIGTGRLGIYYAQSSIYAYEMKDHLGNIRAVIAKNSSTLEIRAYSDYYPYGMVISHGGTDYRYGYQGANAEADAETGWNAFELRMYDSRIARWLQYDPKAEFFSAYMGMGDNPVSLTDPDGGGTNDWFAHQNANGSISLYNDVGNHSASDMQAGELWVNVGESNISEDAAMANASHYFASNQTYFGNFHPGWQIDFTQQMAYSYPPFYSSIVPAAQPAVGSRENSTPWIDIALDQKGATRDKIGNNPKLMAYINSTISPKEAAGQTQTTPWCACFLNWTFKQANMKGTGSALAFSYKDYGQKLNRLAYGSIIVLKWSHVTTVLGKNLDGRIVTLGGNQGDHAVTIGTVDSSAIIAIRYPAGFTPNYNLPKYNVHGAPLNFKNTH